MALMRHAKALGLELVREKPEIVVLLRDTRFTYRKLERAANAVVRGAALIVANPDDAHPGRGGALVPETGALLAALAACVDLASVGVEMIGKPAAPLFLKACAALNIAPVEALMIGDNPATDVAGARALGMAALRIESDFDFREESFSAAFERTASDRAQRPDVLFEHTASDRAQRPDVLAFRR
jgi:4-nitrophenyl phosphatase